VDTAHRAGGLPMDGTNEFNPDWDAMAVMVEEQQKLAAKMESYKELMDAHAKELDRAMELLSRAENEMRYAGWTRLESDNPARNGVYEQIKRFLR
jgi:thiamine pyrophosphate-dependent acetolactate synthase large subunit-like protein